MAAINIAGKTYDIELFVFDKDGLMFKSQTFWSELGEARINSLKKYLCCSDCLLWCKLFGLEVTNGKVTYTDPVGIFATASPQEEISVTAGFLISRLGISWSQARAAAKEVFLNADENLCLAKALCPHLGFPEILHKLQKANIPWTVATSDTEQRVVESLNLFGTDMPMYIITPAHVKNGKPNPDMLKLISEKTNIPLSKIAMVGDSYVDVQMAKAAGAIGIGIPETAEMRKKAAQFSDIIIESLNEITI